MFTCPYAYLAKHLEKEEFSEAAIFMWMAEWPFVFSVPEVTSSKPGERCRKRVSHSHRSGATADGRNLKSTCFCC